MKKPKLKVPALKVPGKKITIKNRFLQKNLLSLVVVAVLAIGTGTAYGALTSRVVDRGEDPVNGINQDRYQVLVSGEGFKLSKKQEKDYKLQKKQNEVNAANAAKRDPIVIRNSSGSRVFRTGSHRFNYRGSTFKTSKNPRVSSNISEQISMEDSWKAGDTLKFRVSAYAYPYGTKNAIPSNQIKVTINGKEATLYNSKKGAQYYSVVLDEGKNKIVISATDKKTKKTVKLGPYTVKAGAGSGGGGGGNTDPTDPTEGTDPAPTEVKVSVNYGFGSFESNPMVIDDNTTALDVLSNTEGIKVSNGAIEYVDVDSYTFDDDKLIEIYKKIKDIGSDEEVNEEEYNKWFTEEVEQKVSVNGKVRLGKNYPFSSTKWTYSQNGDNLASGITLTFVLYED